MDNNGISSVKEHRWNPWKQLRLYLTDLAKKKKCIYVARRDVYPSTKKTECE